MNLMIGSYRNIGALAFGIFWLTTIAMVRLLKGDFEKTISDHASSSKKVIMIFGGVSLLSSVLLELFFLKWFTPTFKLGIIFNSIIFVTFVLYATAGIVPDIKGVLHKIHLSSALAASILLLPSMVIITMNDLVSRDARIFTGLAVLTMLYIGYILIVNSRAHKKLLLYEALYFLCFDISIIVVTYIR